MMNRATERLVRRLADQNRRLRAVERSSQASRRSVEAGTLDIHDEDGEVVQTVGVQPDGTVAVVDRSSTPPPAATDLTVAAGIESVVASWSGAFVTPPGVAVSRVVVHMSPEEDFEPELGTETADLPLTGGDVLIPGDADVDTYVRIVTVSTAGVWSEPSDQFVVTPRRPPEGGGGPFEPVQPGSSPDPEAIGVAGAVLLRWPAILNDTPVEYDVHVSTVEGFAPSAGTLLDSYGSTQATVRTIPDGTPLEYDVTYYFRVVARSGELAADPGAEASAAMDRLRNADLWADAIDGMTITGATVRTASGGQRVQLDTEGLRTFDSTDDETAALTAAEGGLALTGGLVADEGGEIVSKLDTTSSLGEPLTVEAVMSVSEFAIFWNYDGEERNAVGRIRGGASSDGIGSLSLEAGDTGVAPLPLNIAASEVFIGSRVSSSPTPTSMFHLTNKKYVDALTSLADASDLVDASSPFTIGNVMLVRVGPMIFFSCETARSSGSSPAYTTFAVVPAGWGPLAETALLSSVPTAATTWDTKARIIPTIVGAQSDCLLQIAMGSSSPSAMNVAGFWPAPN